MGVSSLVTTWGEVIALIRSVPCYLALENEQRGHLASNCDGLIYPHSANIHIIEEPGALPTELMLGGSGSPGSGGEYSAL